MLHDTPHKLAGQSITVNAKLHNHESEQAEFRVEDWWDRVSGGSWMNADGNPAAMIYGMRSGLAGLPTDNEVVYGKDEHGYGHLVHTSEISEESA